AADLLFSPVLRKFPALRIALSEGGIGWIPYFLERVDYVYAHHHLWTGQDFGDMLPSQVFKERIVTCFIDDAFGVENRHHLNLDMVTWECDYPHSDSTWPNAPEMAMKYLAGVPDADVDRITHENAMRIFRYDPFAVRPKEQCTVAALRAEATDVDTSLRPRKEGAKKHQTLAADLSKMASR
ncbi:MAG TPA: amidohydrolase family protein, partial [Acidimicrobiales bacterium]|nr:amidohydrolase family protein [Acidimicrobiales bacterium]